MLVFSARISRKKKCECQIKVFRSLTRILCRAGTHQHIWNPCFYRTRLRKNTLQSAAHAVEKGTMPRLASRTILQWNLALFVILLLPALASAALVSGSPATFPFSVTDPDGQSDLQSVQLLIGDDILPTGICHVGYLAGPQLLFLRADDGSWPTAPVGSTTPLSNKQCSIDPSGFVRPGPADTKFSFTVRFAATFTGQKKVYGLVEDRSGLRVGWFHFAYWSLKAPSPPVITQFSPTSARGETAFSATINDPDADLATVHLQIGSEIDGTRGCHVGYHLSTRQLFVRRDDGSWALATVGSTAPLTNGRCSIDMASFRVPSPGPTTVVTIPIKFASQFTGKKNVYVIADDSTGLRHGWVTVGNWTPAGTQPPILDGVITERSLGGAFTFMVKAGDPDGPEDLGKVHLLIGRDITLEATCHVGYDYLNRQVFLRADTGDWLFANVGSSTSLSNGRCTLQTSLFGAPEAFGHPTFTIAFKSLMPSTNNIYAIADDRSNNRVGWLKMGTLNITEAPTVQGWRVVKNTGRCSIVAPGVTGTSVIRVKVDKLSNCGITQNGQRIMIDDAWHGGNIFSPANVGPGKSPSDYSQLARTVRSLNVAENTFEIYDADDSQPIANVGTWAYGGTVMRVEKATHRGVQLFVSASSEANLTSTAANGMWNPGSETRKAIEGASDAWHANKLFMVVGADPSGIHALHDAIRWRASGSPVPSIYRDYVMWWLKNEKPFQTVAYDNAFGTPGGYPGSSLGDYRLMTEAYHFGSVINMMWDSLDGPTKLLLREYYLADHPRSKGGIDFEGTPHSQPQWRAATGQIAATIGSSTVTCATVCNFAAIQVGDWFVPRPYVDPYGQLHQVTKVNGNVSLVLNRPYTGSGNVARGDFNVGPPWKAGDLGLIYLSQNAGASMLCGVSMYKSTGHPGAMCANYPNKPTWEWGSRLGSSYSDAVWNNHVIAANNAQQALGMGLVISGDSRALLLAQLSFARFYHYIYPALSSNMVGISPTSANGYWQLRVGMTPVLSLGWMKNSWADGPEYGDDAFYRGIALANMAMIPGETNRIAGWAHGAFVGCCGSAPLGPGLAVVWARPDLEVAKEFRYFVHNIWGNGRNFTASQLRYAGNDDNVALVFFYDDPLVQPKFRDNTTMLLTETSRARCLAIYAPGNCHDTPQLGMLSWDSAMRKHGFANARSHYRLDHAGQSHEVQLSMQAGGKVLMAGDSETFIGFSPGHHSVVSIGSDANFKEQYPEKGNTTIDRAYGGPSLALLAADISDHYLPGAGVVAVKHVFYHLKPLGKKDHWVERVEVVTATPKPVRWYGHFYKGTPAGTIAFKPGERATLENTQGSAAKLVTLFDGGSTVTESGSASDGRYTNQRGYTFRVQQEALSANATELWRIHRLTADSSAEVPVVTRTTSGVHTAVMINEPGSEKLLLSAPSGSNSLNHCTAAVPADGTQVVCDGLAAGKYVFRVNGMNVVGCESVEVIVGEHVVKCDSVPKGTLMVVDRSAPLPSLIAVTPAAVVLQAGQTQQFASNMAVTWRILSNGAGNISQMGLYTAPDSVAAQQSITVQATSVVDSSKSAVASITVNPVAVAVSPTTVTLFAGQTQQFSTNVPATFRIADGGPGSLSLSGAYTAPSVVTKVQNVTVQFTSLSQPFTEAIATITLLPDSSTVPSGKEFITAASLRFRAELPLSNDSNTWAGMRFVTGPAGLTITHLGRFRHAGNSGTHPMAVFRKSDGVKLAEVEVNMLAGPVGRFVYAELSTRLRLPANTEYYVASWETLGGDAIRPADVAAPPPSAGFVVCAAYNRDAGGAFKGWIPDGRDNWVGGPVSFGYE